MALYLLGLLTLTLLWPACSGVVPLEELFPFGVANGDTLLIRNGNGGWPRQNLSIAFPFLDSLHDALWVNANGAISFLSSIDVFTFGCSGDSTEFRMIAPFWGLTYPGEIPNMGDVFYRQSFDAHILQKATNEVVLAFPDSRSVQLKWAYVVTWVNVTYYPHPYALRTTFQATLATDGVQAYAIFYYNEIACTTHMASSCGGDSSDLSGSLNAQAGFDSGDGHTSFMIPGSCTLDIITMGDRSNVGSPGKWLFRVDNSDIQSAGCSSNFTDNFRVSPSFVDTFGHVDIEIAGPCVRASEIATCRYYDPNGNVTDVLAIKLGNETSMTLLCATPFFYSTGRLRMDLIVSSNDTLSNGTEKVFMGHLYVITPPDSDAPLKVSAQQSADDSDSFELTFTWNPGTRGRDDCDSLIDFALYIKNETDHQLTRWKVGEWIATGVADTGYFKGKISGGLLQNFACGSLEDLVEGAAFGAIRHICGAATSAEYRQHILFNGQTETAKFLGDACSPLFRAGLCGIWHALDPGPPKDLIPCPPTTDQANADTRFQRDEGCGIIKPPCFYHPYVDFCIDSIDPSPSGGMQQCCYKGNRIMQGAYLGGGMASRSHPSIAGGASHFAEDILPWIACCYKQPDSLCSMYYDKRPSDTGANYVPPRPAAASGDPHITTFDLLDYTFNGAGEFWMLKNSTVQPILMQARMEQFFDGTALRQATVFTAFVMKDPVSPIIQVQKSSAHTVNVLVDGIAMDLTTASLRSVPFNGARVTVLDDLSKVSVSFSSGFSFQITTTEGAFSLMAVCDESYKGDKTHGLLGVFDNDPTNDLQTPDGTIVPFNSTLEDIHYKFGMTWMISATDSLFDYGSKQYSDYNFPNFRPNFNFDESMATPDARLVCGTQRDCLYDYVTTGSASIANQTRSFAEQFNQTVQVFDEEIKLCPTLSNPANGYCQVPNYFPQTIAFFICFEGYQILGDSVLFCDDNYQWNGTAPVCAEDPSSTQSSATTVTTRATTTTATIIATQSTITQSSTLSSSVVYTSPIEKNDSSSTTSTTTATSTTPTTPTAPDGANSLNAIVQIVFISVGLLLTQTYKSYF